MITWEAHFLVEIQVQVPQISPLFSRREDKGIGIILICMVFYRFYHCSSRKDDATIDHDRLTCDKLRIFGA